MGLSSLFKETPQPSSIATVESTLHLSGRWFSQVLVLATRIQFAGHKYLSMGSSYSSCSLAKKATQSSHKNGYT